jgi:hypothetical protein
MPARKPSPAKAKAAKRPAPKPPRPTRGKSAASKAGKPSVRKTASKAPAGKAKAAPLRKAGSRERGLPPKGSRSAPKPPVKVVPPTVPYVSAAYLKALADYERAMTALQKRDYVRAEEMFAKMMEAHPAERDLVDRARVYINLCRNQRATAGSPQGFDDHYYQGVVLSNRGQHHEALQLFDKALRFKQDSDKVHYAMAAAYAQVSDRVRALTSLRRAVELDPSCRLHARQDPDFDSLHGEPDFDAIVGSADRKPAG